MIDDEHDEATYGKMLAAAEEIRAMAQKRPAQAAAMFEQARHLLELAEQIRNDWLRRAGSVPESVVKKPERERLGDAKPVRNAGMWITQSAD